MIFVTVGGQMPFDRLIRAVDAWAATAPDAEVFAQIGDGRFEPRNIEWTRFLEPPAFRRMVADASAVVAHAGMGTIITALECGKPILVMPRRGDLRETRNDHQVATAERFLAQGRVAVALDETSLAAAMDDLASIPPPEEIGANASDALIEALRAFVEAD